MTAIDVVIPAHEKDFPTLHHSVRSVLRHVSPVRNVIVVSERRFAHRDSRVRWVAEPRPPVFPGPDEVRSRWSARSPEQAGRASWMYQQLLKLGAPEYVDDLAPAYVVVDSDVVFLRPVSFDQERYGRLPWSYGYEHHDPYADAYERLFGARPPVFSLTAHHMLYDVTFLLEMHAEIARRHGKPWHEAYLDAPDPAESSGISEMDVYGPWVVARHPADARRRQLAWRDVRVVPGVLARAMYAPDFDFVAAHAWYRVGRAERLAGYPLRVAAEIWAERGRWTSS